MSKKVEVSKEEKLEILNSIEKALSLTCIQPKINSKNTLTGSVEFSVITSDAAMNLGRIALNIIDDLSQDYVKELNVRRKAIEAKMKKEKEQEGTLKEVEKKDVNDFEDSSDEPKKDK